MIALLVFGTIALVTAVFYLGFRRRAQRHEAEKELTAVRQAFAFLEAHGFTLQDATYDEQAFGNVVVDYQKDRVRLRVIRDRLQWFCELSIPSLPDSEFDSLVMLRAIGKQSEIDALIGDWYRSLDLLAQVVASNISAFLDLLSLDLPKLRKSRAESEAQVLRELRAQSDRNRGTRSSR